MVGADAPHYAFHEAGHEVNFFSPNSDKCAADGLSDPHGYSASDLISMGFLSTPSLAPLVEKTPAALREITIGKVDALVDGCGQAPMFSFGKATSLHSKFVDFYEAGKVTSALCHSAIISNAPGSPMASILPRARR